MFTPTTQNTIKYTFQLNAESQPINRFQRSTMPKLLATVHGGTEMFEAGKGESK